MKTESLFHRIRSLLKKAEDVRGFAPERKIAQRMAERLMRKHKFTEADVWAAGEDEAQPGLNRMRIPVAANAGCDRHMMVTHIVMYRYPAVQMFSWSSRVTPGVGAMEFVSATNHLDESVNFWMNLNLILQRQWQESEELRKTLHARARILWKLKDLVTPEYDEFSWLAGVADGFEAQDKVMGHQTREHPEFKKVEAEERLLLLAPKKRRRLPKFNPMALAVIPKVILPLIREDEYETQWLERATKQAVPETIQASGETNRPKTETPARQVHQPSFDAGFVFGRKLSQKWPRKNL
jgi:hypothetical protein